MKLWSRVMCVVWTAILLCGCGVAPTCPEVTFRAAAPDVPGASLYVANTDPYQPGDLEVATIEIAACEDGAPHGHADMLDDDVADQAGAVCPSGDDPQAMRRLTAGLLAAFFRGSLQGDETGFGYLTDVEAAPTSITVDNR